MPTPGLWPCHPYLGSRRPTHTHKHRSDGGSGDTTEVAQASKQAKPPMIQVLPFVQVRQRLSTSPPPSQACIHNPPPTTEPAARAVVALGQAQGTGHHRRWQSATKRRRRRRRRRIRRRRRGEGLAPLGPRPPPAPAPAHHLAPQAAPTGWQEKEEEEEEEEEEDDIKWRRDDGHGRLAGRASQTVRACWLAIHPLHHTPSHTSLSTPYTHKAS